LITVCQVVSGCGNPWGRKAPASNIADEGSGTGCPLTASVAGLKYAEQTIA